MATRSSSPGLAEAARHVAEHAKTIVRLEVRLALQEVKQKVAKAAVATILLVAAALLAGIAVLCGIAAGAAALALVLPAWLALLVVMGGLFLLSAPLGVIGLVLVKRGAPPIPEQAIEEARLTTEALKNGRH